MAAKTLASFLAEEYEHHYSGPDYDDREKDEETGEKYGAHPVHALVDKLRETHTFGRSPEHDFYTPKHEWNNDHRQNVKAVKDYTHSSFQHNENLLSEHRGEGKVYAAHAMVNSSTSDDIQNVATMHKAPTDFHVYSGTGFSPAKFKKEGAGPNDVIKVHLPAFTSTSVTHHAALEFAKKDTETHGGDSNAHHLIKIHVPEGSHGSYLGDHSLHPAEKEYLIPHGAKLHVHPEPTVHHEVPPWENNEPNAKTREFHVWHAKLVHDGVAPTRHMKDDG